MKVKVGNSEVTSFGKGFIPFIRHHANEINQGGWPVLLRKLRTFLRLLWLMLLRAHAAAVRANHTHCARIATVGTDMFWTINEPKNWPFCDEPRVVPVSP